MKKQNTRQIRKEIKSIVAILVVDLQTIQRHYGTLLATEFNQEYIDGFDKTNALIGQLSALRGRA